jgi:alpha-glucosidase
MTTIRYKLSAYIKHLYKEAITSGYPLQRPIFVHYEDDELAYDLQYEYLFGQDMFIKPVIEPLKNKQEVRLPKDNWIHLWSGKSYQGSSIITVECPIGYPPVFYRKDSSFVELFEDITKTYGF